MIPRPWQLPWLGVLLVLVAHLAAGHGQPPPSEAGTLPEAGVLLRPDEVERQRARHLRALGAEAWHRTGHRGQGVKIAILDCGFKGYQEQLGRSLPERVLTRSFRQDGTLEARDSQHGILCAEVIHALAPEAELLLATWEPNQPEQFLQAVAWARRHGARVVSCSVIMPSWSDGAGGGPVHRGLSQILGTGDAPGDMLFFASAGNMARRHWTGSYRKTARGWHAWEADRTGNPVRPWREQVSVELYWPTGCQYELQVYDIETGEPACPTLASCQPERCFAVARFEPQAGKRYAARVKLVEGEARPFHLVSLGADLDYVTAEGSIPFPGDGPAVLAVAAVDAGGRRASYSSCGSSGGWPKPDLAAPVPFPSRCREQPFSGTSAAAPQAAALAALCWSRQPDWTARQVRQELCRWSWDVGPAGHDLETGHGVIRLPRP